MSISIRTNSINEEVLPVTQKELKDLINGEYSKTEDINKTIDSTLKFLSTKSSKFKYIINVTELQSAGAADTKVGSSFGSLWDEKNDGLISVSLTIDADINKILMFTVIFINI